MKTKTGISKIYFVELPKDVQERFHYGSAKLERQSRNTSTRSKVPSTSAGWSDAEKFAQGVATKLEERESILQGKHRPARQS